MSALFDPFVPVLVCPLFPSVLSCDRVQLTAGARIAYRWFVGERVHNKKWPDRTSPPRETHRQSERISVPWFGVNIPDREPPVVSRLPRPNLPPLSFDLG